MVTGWNVLKLFWYVQQINFCISIKILTIVWFENSTKNFYFLIFSRQQEYNKRETAEAKLVKDLDRFEMILQAFEYEKGKLKPLFLWFCWYLGSYHSYLCDGEWIMNRLFEDKFHSSPIF